MRYGVEINVENVYFCGGKRREAAPAESGETFTELNDDGADLPFTMGDDKAPWDEEELPL